MDLLNTDEGTRVILHHSFNPNKKFTKAVYKLCLLDFENVLDILRDKGVKVVNAIVPNDEKLLKFEALFGLEPTQQLSKEDGKVVMYILERKI